MPKPTPRARKASTSVRENSAGRRQSAEPNATYTDSSAKCAECQAVLEIAHERCLQSKRNYRHTEDQRPVHGTHPGLPFSREEDGHGDIEQKVGQQKGLGAGEVLRRVVMRAPDHTDNERAHEAQSIQQPPLLEPCDRQNADIEGSVVRKRAT